MLNVTKETEPLQFLFTPEGFLPDASGASLSEGDAALLSRFKTDRVQALYQLGLEERPADASPSTVFLYLLSDAFFKALTDLPDLELLRQDAKIVLSPDAAGSLLQAVPFALGAEYVTKSWLEDRFRELGNLFSREIGAFNGTVALYLTERSQRLRLPERIFFHLVESPRDEDCPFAFLATYATRTEDGAVRHMPLQYALTEYQGRREKLLELLSCLNAAAEVSPLIAGFMDSGELFHPLRLTAQEAYEFLTHIEAIEETGILCRIPNWWKKKAASVNLTLKLGEEQPPQLGFGAIIGLQPRLEVDGVPLTEADIRELLERTEGLALLKGKWVQVDHARLRSLLSRMEAYPEGITLMEAMRLGLDGGKQAADVGELVSNGAWLSDLLGKLRRPREIRSAVVPKSFAAKLRPYQKDGYTWLRYMDSLGFGACLADDMGLGKTVQVLAYLEKLRLTKKDARVLLVVPASLLDNWQKEAERFTPSLDYLILHGKPSAALKQDLAASKAFLTVTTYGMTARIAELQNIPWDCVVLDEAQAIKNPLTKQTREIKKLPARMRIAMTGTPIENDLTNLWSLFDFLNKGLLGSSQEFKGFCGGLSDHPERYAKLKAMVSPFLLRRVKTDKSIIADLPDKLEMTDYAALTKQQVVLYRKVVAEMEERIQQSDGIERRGLILTAILKLKQICNHPDQYLGQPDFDREASGKYALLREICETIREKRERVLVFTQFREITGQLSDYLAELFGVRGYVLHGGTPVAARGQLVEAFQSESYVPYMVLSVKAGGTGLNLTKASHVIHFDRWWNPAVENQATDRAYRIGQKNNVMVHKLVCRGTIEEKIDAMIASKKELAENVIGSGSEKWITELGNEELSALLRLER